MERVSVKNADLNLRAADNVKSAGRPEESSDEFRKLLEGQRIQSPRRSLKQRRKHLRNL